MDVTLTNSSRRMITIQLAGSKAVGLLPGATIILPAGTEWSIVP